MCPSPPVLLDIDARWTDEEVLLFLGRRRAGDPVPPNVITEVNPFVIEPWDSPEETWFLYDSKESQPHSGGSIIEVSRNGYWKSMDDIRISTSTTTVGRKTTREFYIGQAPVGDRTGWMMHEYQAENMVVQGNSKEQDSSSLCRLFLQFYEWPNNEELDPTSSEQCNPVSPRQCNPVSLEQCNLVGPEQCDPVSPGLSDPVGVESMLMRFLEQEERNSPRDAAYGSQVVGEDEQRRLELSGGPPQNFVPLQDPVNANSEDDMQTNCDFSKGDFLELKDLYDPESSSTSSDNSSLVSMNSDDCFDAEAMLRDIENGSGQDMDQDRVDHRFNISTPLRSNQVVIRPPTSGSAFNNIILVDSDNRTADSIVAQNTTLPLSTMDPQSDADLSISGSSQGSQVNDTRSGSSEGGSSPRLSGSKNVRKIAKLGKKYCCLAPF
ncbi:protein ATAF2-like [Iris pallida]|uniref:Protein ATAF2-like n=1 Tax=Iris pallida TaxID=29817 RepID=A0AAX6EWE8_IRIPA|nr:protein ATAF2-like [Iris pallida]